MDSPVRLLRLTKLKAYYKLSHEVNLVDWIFYV